MFTGAVEVEPEQRVWLHRKWVQQPARIDATGILKVSSTHIHERLEYNLCGSIAVFLTGALQQTKMGSQYNK
jgi:hypothetical protein